MNRILILLALVVTGCMDQPTDQRGPSCGDPCAHDADCAGDCNVCASGSCLAIINVPDALQLTNQTSHGTAFCDDVCHTAVDCGAGGLCTLCAGLPGSGRGKCLTANP